MIKPAGTVSGRARPRRVCGVPVHAMRLERASLVFAVVAALCAPGTMANPEGPKIVVGEVQISSTGSRVEVRQGSQRGIVDWRSFDIAPGEHTRFVQPSANAVTLNRIRGGGASRIDGDLTANGQVFIVNPSGVVFGRSARVSTGGLLATTADIEDSSFMAGYLDFDRASPDPEAGIVNRGELRVGEGGSVVLAGPRVSNEGTINARLGKVSLSGTQVFTVDFEGDELLSYSLGSEVRDARTDGAALVSNSGSILADGGVVSLSARAADDVVDRSINMNGIVEARAISERGGKIVLSGGEHGVVRVEGRLDASASQGHQIGGEIKAIGDMVGVLGDARITADGGAGGGTVAIGGEIRGGVTGRNARRTAVGANAMLSADAASLGDGGEVIVWSDGHTRFDGNVTARGGALSGDGGFVEISGKRSLDLRGGVDVSAPAGSAGTVLLDPSNITIVDGSVGGGLITEDPALTFFIADPPNDGDVTIGKTVLGSIAGTLILEATDNIEVEPGENLALRTDLTVFKANTVSLGADVQTFGGDVRIVAASLDLLEANIVAGDGNITAVIDSLVSATSPGFFQANVVELSPFTAGSSTVDTCNVCLATINVSNGALSFADSDLDNITANELRVVTSGAGDVIQLGGGPTVTGPGGFEFSPGYVTSVQAENGGRIIVGSVDGPSTPVVSNFDVALKANNIDYFGDIFQSGASMTTVGELTLNPVTGSTTVRVQTTGPAGGSTQGAAISLDSLITGAGVNDIALDAGTDGVISFQGDANVANLTVNNGRSLSLGGALSVGALNVTVSNGFQVTGPVLSQTGLAVDAGTGSALFGSTVAVNANAMTVSAGTDIVFGDSVTVPGAASMRTATGGMELRGAGNTFGTLALFFGAGSEIPVLQTTGTTALEPSALRNSLSFGALTSAGSVEINTPTGGAVAFEGAVQALGLTLADALTITFAAELGAANLALGAVSSITVDGAATVTGASTFVLQQGALALANDGNTFGGAVTVLGGDRANVSLVTAGPLTLGASSFGAGDVALTVGDINVPAAQVAGVGGLSVRPFNAGATFAIGDGVGGDTNLDATEVANLSAGFAAATFGRTDFNGVLALGDVGFSVPVVLQANAPGAEVSVTGAYSRALEPA